MKKRILSLLLCLVMVVSLMLPTAAYADDDWEEGIECEYCGEYIFGDWVCDYGSHCGEYSDHYECYEMNHCGNCYDCFDGEPEYVCEGCGAGPCCLDPEDFCEACGLCIYCVEEICWNCGKCINCNDTWAICEYCGMCYDDDCGGMCSEGTDHLCRYDHDGYACESCGQCLLNADGEKEIPFCNQCRRCEECIEKCSAWDGDSHDLCLECHDDYEYCPDCHHCWLGDIISGGEGTPIGCMDCGRCIECVGEICESCGMCFECVDKCDHCEKKCLSCHEEEGKACTYCGMCSEGVGVRCSDCGACGECVTRCDTCRACMTCHDDNHCPDCGACGRAVKLCEGCGYCPDCTEYCDECGLCANCEEDTHCTQCYEHKGSTDLCSSCGACGDCVDLCTDCGECFDCADEANHCSICRECYESEDICADCGMCNDCADGEGLHCSNDLCDNCLENYIYCDTCKKCIECIEDDGEYCYSCYQCTSHHVGGKCNGKDVHTHNFGDLVSNASHHWKECRLCKEKKDNAVHVFNSDKTCTICGYDAATPITITTQPKNARAQVSDIHADLDDPLCPNNNKASFKVAATITGKGMKGTLSYQWYILSWDGSTANPVKDSDRSDEGKGVVSGAKTSKLTTRVDWVCGENSKYFCRITLTSSDGKVLATVDSDTVELKVSHVYNQCEPVNDKWDYALDIKLDSGKIEQVQVHKDDGGHKDYCCGEADEEHSSPLQNIVAHNFDTPVTVMARKDGAASFTEYYQYTCLDCGAERYVEKHEHNYELVMDLSKPETITFVETYSNNHTHPLRCTVEGCTAVSHEKHSFIPNVYAPPVKHENGSVTPARYSLECRQCGYTIGGRELYEANNNTHWDTLRTLVSADYAAVEVEKSYGDYGFGTFGLAMPGDTIYLIPHQKDGQKVTSWTTKYTDYTQTYSGGENDGKYVTTNNLGLKFYQEGDGTWWFTMPYPKQFNDLGVNPAGWLHLTPVYATCKHENGTKLANKVDAVCIYDGYTGDEVCKDCGQIIGKVGDFVAAPSTDHTGEWQLIEGTAVEANCTKKGYTGDYKCSDCGDIKHGTDLGYKHGHTTVKNASKGTCVTPAYTGDIYCTKCHNTIRTGKILSLNEDNHVHTHIDLARAATCTKPGSTGYKICDDCGKTLSTPKSIPVLGHVWGDPVVTEPTLTEPGVKTYHCTREGCNGIKTEDIPSLSSTAIESVSLTVTAPATGKIVMAARTTTPGCSIANTSWLDWGGSDAVLGSSFAAGTTYTVKVELEVTGTYAFTAATVFTVNGEAATVAALGMDSVTVNYTFPATDKATTPPTPPTPPTPVDPDKPDVPVEPEKPDVPVEPEKPDVPVEPEKPDVPVKPEKPVNNPFTDVPKGEYYEDAVLWAIENKITEGTSATTFSPDMICTRAQAVTLLWRAAGCPAPKSASMPFTDVPKGEYYYDAVLWAVENGITKGTSATTFSPELNCTRAQIVTMLWRSEKMPAGGSGNAFGDITKDDYYYEAVLWAVENKVTNGTGNNLFSPDLECSRAQIVTMLYRLLG